MFGGQSVVVVVSLVIALVLVVVINPTDGYSSTYNPKEYSRNVTSLIDTLLDIRNYDKRIRPGFGGPPVKITVDMNVRSMGPISERSEDYAMQVYLRQTWSDSRLRFNKADMGRKEFSMNWMFAQKIWRPDTFFINGKNSYSHDITAPNLFVRMRHDGQIYMSMRLTVRASCKMRLRKFPLDTQICPLRISSYSYNSDDILYVWKDKVTVNKDVELADYKIVNVTMEESMVAIRRVEKISTVSVKFHLVRLTGFFLLQVYVPCILIVCSSWVGFWITKKDAPGRVCLGVNNVLCMCKLGFGGRSIFPLVSYPTALDYFVLLCFWFTFATMVEYAAINFLQRKVVATMNLLARRRIKLREEEEYIDKIAMEGAGCIKVDATLHTFILETYKLHLISCPSLSEAANTLIPKETKKSKEAKLLQALKLPLSLVPGARDPEEEKRMYQHLPPPASGAPEEEETMSKAESELSLSLKAYTPKILKRLSSLTSKFQGKSDPDIPETPEPNEGPPSPTVRPLPPLPDSPSSSQDLQTQTTPSLSPIVSPLLSTQSSFSSATTSAGPVTPPPTPVSLGTAKQEKDKDQGKEKRIVIKEDDDPPPPPKEKEDITVFQLLVRKKYLMDNMTADSELPTEEDLLDRFSAIDLYSRRIFPSLFTIIFTIYWILFNYHITDEFPNSRSTTVKDGLVN